MTILRYTLLFSVLLGSIYSVTIADEVALELEYSEDLSKWIPVQIQPEMIGEDGKIYIDSLEESGFFRMRIEFPEKPPEGFVLIPSAGIFLMGDANDGNNDDDAPPVVVSVSAFYMSQYQVTWELWNDVRDWAMQNGYTDIGVGGGKAANHPVQMVNWWDVVKWCNARSEREGLTPVYRNSDDSVFKTGTTAPIADWLATGYRLPTEAEWERGARGGVAGQRFPWGDEIDHSFANYRANGSAFSYDISPYTTATEHPTYDDGTQPYTSPVGSFAANDFGLYDMAGNVFEWCWDFYLANAYKNGISDPKGPEFGASRVVRGGSWSGNASLSRSAQRLRFLPASTSFEFGFRPVRSLAP